MYQQNKTNNIMKLIGKNLFSKVYQLNETEVFIKSECLVKECIANFIENEFFPPIKRTDEINEYTCKYYPKVTSLKTSLTPEHYEMYKELRSLNTHTSNIYDGYSKCYTEFEKISNEDLRESLLYTLSNLSNYGSDIRFEISLRNVAVENGKLILLDVFFFQSQANEIRNKKKNYATI